MRTDRPRYDKSTKRLLDFERRLTRLKSTPSRSSDFRFVISELWEELEKQGAIRTSRELSYTLQLAMMLIVTQVRFAFFPDSEQTGFFATCTLFDRRNSVLVVKPCSFGPGRCSAWQTTIELPIEGRSSSGPIGLSGEAFLSGEVIHCSDLLHRKCPVQIAPEGTHSVSALCVPLRRQLVDVLDRFRVADADSHCCKNLHLRDPEATQQTVAAFSLEATTGALDSTSARRILGDPLIRKALLLLYDALADYCQQRPAYELLKSCTSLFQLSQHSLGARAAYEALLREISEICDGADVTLHLKDLFEKKDSLRCLRLVAGTGPRFREFLINDRYGRGLVGEALRRERMVWRTSEEIQRGVNTRDGAKYHRLLPDTGLDLAIPIWYFSRVIGVINVEWGGGSALELVGATRGRQTAYFHSKQKILERVAAYLSQVIDYFDDLSNEDLGSRGDVKSHLRGTTARHQIMAYYVGNTMAAIDRWASAEEVEETEEQGKGKRRSHLQEIIDAVGYLVTFEHNLRVLVSTRKIREKEGGERVLHLDCEHGFPARDEKPRGDIPLQLRESVLASCAALGVPIFGEILAGARLRPAELSRRLAPAGDRKQLEQDLVYRRAGNHPVYEVGVPLVFGRLVIGTFDFELFSLETRSPRRRGRHRRPYQLEGHKLVPFLEWARAITFCIAYEEDRKRAFSEGKLYGMPAFHRFQRLCAQIMANVSVPGDMLAPLAREYLRSLLPVRKIQVTPSKEMGQDSEQEGELAGGARGRERRTLWYRGRCVGEMEIELDSGNQEPEVSRGPGARHVVGQLIDAFYTATLSASEKEIPDTRGFKFRLRSVEQGVRTQLAELRQEHDLPPARFLVRCFEILHTELRRALAPRAGDSEHGWYLYLVRRDGDRAILRCGSPWQRWAFMRTHEMSHLVSRVRRSSDPLIELRKIFAVEIGKEHLLDEWPKTIRSGAVGDEEIENIFYEALVDRDYQYPEGGELEETALTLRTVIRNEVLSFVDLNSSPYRSPRKTGWFFGRAPYSIMCLPICLDKSPVGVLHLLRRRGSGDDFSFFKNDEIDAARRLCEALSDCLDEELELFGVDLDRVDQEESLLSRQVCALGERLREALPDIKTAILKCEMAQSEERVQAFCKAYLGEWGEDFVIEFSPADDEWRANPPHHDARGDCRYDLLRVVICFSLSCYPGGKIPESIGQGIRLLVSRNRVIFFCESDEDKDALGDILEDLDYYDHVPDDGPFDVFRSVVASKGRITFPGMPEIMILLRKSGRWSFSKMVEDCGCDGHAIRVGVPEMLRNLQERQHGEPHFFPHWIGYRAWREEA